MLINNVNAAICLRDAPFDGFQRPKKMPVYQFLLPPKVAQKCFIGFPYQSFFTVLPFWWQERASVGILCILISCFSQSKLSWHVFFMAR